MDYLELALNRQSCRSYDKDRPVEEEKLQSLLACARLAPSACNAQPYHITVAAGEKAQAVGELVRGQGMNGFTRDVPLFLVISEKDYNSTAALGAKLKKQDYRSVDIGILSAFLISQAHCLGLGSCILGWFSEKKLQALLNTEHRIRLVIALGYPREGDSLRKKNRKPLDVLVNRL